MQYKQFNNKFILRLDPGEEIVERLKTFCRKEGINLGWIVGIGAANQAKLGLFDVKTKKYYVQELKGNYEITNLCGNISIMEKKVYLHLHINLCDKKLRSFGGHLNSAVVSGTFEGMIVKIQGKAERKFNQEIGLNLLNFL